MEVASVIVHHIPDNKSRRSVELENGNITADFSQNPRAWPAWLIPRLCSYSFITLLLYWILTEQNGFSSSTPSMINPAENATANGYLGYHALGLSLWAVVFMQESFIAYAIPFCCRSSYVLRKGLHIAAQVMGLVLGAGGMTAMLWYKNSTVNIPLGGTDFTIMDQPYYVPYSPHAWLGLGFLVLWMVQCLGRLFPQYMSPERHRFFGRLLYSTGIACCGLGLQQQQTRQLMMSIHELASNSTSIITSTLKPTTWWFSQPSLGVLLLSITSAVTFYYGLS